MIFLFPFFLWGNSLRKPLPWFLAKLPINYEELNRKISKREHLKVFFLGGGGIRPFKIISLISKPILRWGENGKSLRKTTWPPASRMTRARFEPQWSDEEQFRVLKTSIHIHSAKGSIFVQMRLEPTAVREQVVGSLSTWPGWLLFLLFMLP